VSKVFSFLLPLVLLNMPGVAMAAPLLTGEALLAALSNGGYSLYLRHVGTDWSQNDKVLQVDDWRSCDPERMRQLSTSGRAEATAIGVAIRKLEIPVSEVLASPYCRTVETATLMRLGEVVESAEVMNLRSAEYFGGRSMIVASAQKLLGSRPPGRGNRLIVAHGNVARAATQVYPAEGELLVFEAIANGFSLRGRIRVEGWYRLLELAG